MFVRARPVVDAGPSRLPFTADRSRCLVIQTAFLGDVVLTTPLLSRLAERVPVQQRSMRSLEWFLLAGRTLGGGWAGVRFLIGRGRG